MLTILALAGLLVITVAGSILTVRSRTPSISVIIDDEPALRFVYVLFVGALAISRTGLVFTSTFYRVPTTRDTWSDGWWNFVLPWTSVVAGAAQLVSFFLVAAFSVTLDPTYHYTAALGTVIFGIVCEFSLLMRRFEVRSRKGDDDAFLVVNLFVLMATYASLFAFGGISFTDEYAEVKTNSAIAEWIGYYLFAFANRFRNFDMRMHAAQKKLEPTYAEVLEWLREYHRDAADDWDNSNRTYTTISSMQVVSNDESDSLISVTRGLPQSRRYEQAPAGAARRKGYGGR